MTVQAAAQWGAAFTVLAACLLAACAGGRANAEPGPPPPPPDLAGARVMLVPARAGAPASLDRELRFWLVDRAPATEWVTQAEIRATIERAAAAGFDLDAPRALVDMGGERYRLQDPLYGDLRRLGAILDAELALVPLGIRELADSAEAAGPATEITAALVSIRGGRVVWYHAVRGSPAGSGDARVASAAETLARTLIPGDG